jgi:hypothetical protein
MGSTVVLVLDAHWAKRLLPACAPGNPMPVQLGLELSD